MPHHLSRRTATEDGRRVKILFGINKLNVGGAERIVLNQVHAIDRTQYDPYLVTLLPPTEPNFDHEVEYLGANWKKLSFRGTLDVVSWWKLYRYLRHERFDAVISNLFFTGLLLRTAAVAARVPVILATELNVYGDRSRRWIYIEKLLARFTYRIMANSKEVLEAASRQLDLPREKFLLNYSTVDTKAIQPATPSLRSLAREKYDIHADALVFATAGRLVEQKGQRYLIEAFGTVSASGGTQIKLIIFGEGAYRRPLEEQVKKAGLEDKVVLPGVAPIGDITAVADVFVLPSLWEGMSLVLLEAMAGGLPIVATDVSGSRELVSEANGFLVRPKDAAALAKKMQVLADDAALRVRLGAASRTEAQKYSVEHNLEKVYETIDAALKEYHKAL